MTNWNTVQYIILLNDYKNTKMYKSKNVLHEFRLNLMTQSNFQIQLKKFDFDVVEYIINFLFS